MADEAYQYDHEESSLMRSAELNGNVKSTRYVKFFSLVVVVAGLLGSAMYFSSSVRRNHPRPTSKDEESNSDASRTVNVGPDTSTALTKRLFTTKIAINTPSTCPLTVPTTLSTLTTTANCHTTALIPVPSCTTTMTHTSPPTTVPSTLPTCYVPPTLHRQRKLLNDTHSFQKKSDKINISNNSLEQQQFRSNRSHLSQHIRDRNKGRNHLFERHQKLFNITHYSLSNKSDKINISNNSLELPNKSVCIYAYNEKNQQYKNNLIHFLKNGGILDNVDYYLVINGVCTIDIPNLPNLRIVYRKNVGYDFGAWQNVIKNHISKKYDYYIFINSSVRGPYLKTGIWLDKFLELFSTGPDVKIVGTTINIYFLLSLGTKPQTHVQSMFFILNAESYNFLYDKNFFDDEEVLNKETKIWNITVSKEIRMSQILLENGWNINCLLPKYRDLDYRKIKTNINPSGDDPCHPGAYFGGTMTPQDVIFFKLYRFLDKNCSDIPV